MTQKKEIYDTAIVGGGPAGLTAAIYLSRAGLHVLVLEKQGIGGQVSSTWTVENYPGVRACSGFELVQTMKEQAEAFGTKFQFADVRAMERREDNWRLRTAEEDILARSVVLAMGAVPRKAGFLGEEEFSGRGVSYCAACDGAFFRDREIYVIGGGVAAVEESIFLARMARKVTLIIRRGQFSCPASVSDRLKQYPQIEIRFFTRVEEVSGDGAVNRIRFRSLQTDEEWVREAQEGFGVFVLAGRQPDTGWLPKEIRTDGDGYLQTDRDQRTALPGVFAAGDVCEKKLRQIATAVSDGAVAAAELEKQFFA